MVIETAVIIAGGKGSRLEEHTEDLPKPLVKVFGKPILERVLEWLRKNGVKKVVIGVAYKKELVKKYFGDGSKWGLKLIYVDHDENGGTEDAFKMDIEKSQIEDENFYAMNCDQITDLNLGALSKFHINNQAIATLVTVNLRTNFGLIKSDSENQIVEFQEKGEIPERKINSGIYLFNKSIKKYLGEGNIEENTFRKLSEERKAFSFHHDGVWLTVNNKKELKEVEKFLEENREIL